MTTMEHPSYSSDQKMLTSAGTDGKQLQTTRTLSVVCRADCFYLKQESPRLLEERVRALHIKLLEEARKQEGFGNNVLVVTFVNPLQEDQRPCKVPLRQEIRKTTSMKSKLPRTCSLRQLPSLDNTVESSNTYGEDVEEIYWGHQVNDCAQESATDSNTFFGKLMGFLWGSSGDGALP